MASYKHEGAEEPSESDCPVCYESLSGTGRTLSCGHGFCHDCLVRTLLVAVPRAADGVIRADTLICPVCRHLTFIRRQEDAAVRVVVVSSKTTDKEQQVEGEEAKDAQTLQVPIRAARAPPGDFTHDALSRGVRAWRRWVRRVVCAFRRRRHRGMVLPSLDHSASQIFIISTQGRPMAEEDALSAVSSPAAAVLVVDEEGGQPPPHGARRRRRVKICTTGSCLLFLLCVFTLLALVAATLPWILLA